MGLLRRWLLSVVLMSFATGIAEQIVPKGKERSLVRLIAGLMLMLAILRPLGEISWERPSISIETWLDSFQTQTEIYRDQQQKELCTIIAEKLETYIWDKAIELGVDGEVWVSVTVQSTGIPLPDTVSIGAPFDSALAVWLEEVVGIPAEKQKWLEGNTWTIEKSSGS